jgi:hypothetical protein
LHLVGCQAISYKLLQPLRGPGMVHYIRTVETPAKPDGPDNSTPVMWWRALGEVPGDGGKQVNKQESYFSHDAEG